MPFDAVLFEEALAAKILNIILHPRAVACVTQLGEVVYRNDAELADLDEGLHFRFTERVLAIAITVGGAEAVGIVSVKEIWFSTVALCGRASARAASRFESGSACSDCRDGEVLGMFSKECLKVRRPVSSGHAFARSCTKVRA